EVERVFGKIGRAESATDPAPLTMIETVVRLKPRSAWRPGLDREALIAELDRRVRLPGLVNAWVQPIRARIEMQATGVRTALAVRLSGADLDQLAALAERVEAVLAELPGTRAAFAERSAAARYLELVPDRIALARHGLTMADFAEWVAGAIGGEPLAQAYVGRARYAVALRLPPEWRDSPERLAGLVLRTPSGTEPPLGRLARIAIVPGP
ncbi:MAG: efflux RND transporter permease subunit, partial [Chloroflexota bacterium]|nr:efflux RND transporter permease subunit [Chloroflexota bacterium]